MTKPELIKLLLDDFINMFPDSNYATRKKLFESLSGMDIEDLKLLATGAKQTC